MDKHSSLFSQFVNYYKMIKLAPDHFERLASKLFDGQFNNFFYKCNSVFGVISKYGAT